MSSNVGEESGDGTMQTRRSYYPILNDGRTIIDFNHPFNLFKIVSNHIRFGDKLGFIDGFVNRFPWFYDRFFCYFLPAVELEVVLEKK